MKIELEVNSNSIFVCVFLIPLELKRLCHKKIRKVDFCLGYFYSVYGIMEIWKNYRLMGR